MDPGAFLPEVLKSPETGRLRLRIPPFGRWHAPWVDACIPDGCQGSARASAGIDSGKRARVVSQGNVERFVGRLATDESFRRRFWQEREATLAAWVAAGCELNPCERRALAALSRESVEGFAAAIDPRIQKSDLCAADREHENETQAGPSARRLS